MLNKYKEAYNETGAFTTNDYETLEPGGYICTIKGVEVEKKHYGELFRISFDIWEGDKKGFYTRLYKSLKEKYDTARWSGMYYQSLSLKGMGYFKAFMESVEQSNNGYKWNWNADSLKGKLFGGIFGEEEYENNQGELKTIVKCMYVTTVGRIRNNNYTVPEKKVLQKSDNAFSGFTGVDSDDDLPF